jgi:cytosine/adenosine deaminase-related metal-dependent hydrolase
MNDNDLTNNQYRITDFMIKKIAAHYVFPINDKPIKNGVITYDENGKILEISQPAFNVQEIAGLEFYAGILVPGFGNVHCHLELSHMKAMLPMHTGLHGFVSKIAANRSADDETILKASQNADIKMWFNGIAAVGDISNTNHTFRIKQKSKITYHTFVEIFSTIPELAQIKFKSGCDLQNQLDSLGLASSVVPHAPYSVSPAMFELISKHSIDKQQFISMHNQECPSENELYHTKSGELFSVLSSLGVDFSAIPQTGKNSLESVKHLIDKKIKTILVHNTYINQDDIEKASVYFNDLYWAFCPNANLYIENKLPDIQLFRRLKQKIAIGTDSLASNHQLSVLEEIKTITKNFPDIPLEELFTWATLNGAKALGFENNLGSFEIGKTPGINLISNLDFNNLRLKQESLVKRVV